MNNQSFFAALFAASGLVCSSCDGGVDQRVAALEARVDALEKARPRPKRVERKPAGPVDIPVRLKDPYLGAPDAKVTVVEAFEYACPYCATLAPTMRALADKYAGKPVRFVPKQFVVHPGTATEPALAVCAAANLGAYAEYDEALWSEAWRGKGRPRLDQSKLEKDALIALAEKVGLDRDAFVRELDGAACKARLKRDRSDLIRAGVRGTPTLFVNGERYAGPRSVEAISKAIDRALGG